MPLNETLVPTIPRAVMLKLKVVALTSSIRHIVVCVSRSVMLTDKKPFVNISLGVPVLRGNIPIAGFLIEPRVPSAGKRGPAFVPVVACAPWIVRKIAQLKVTR